PADIFEGRVPDRPRAGRARCALRPRQPRHSPLGAPRRAPLLRAGTSQSAPWAMMMTSAAAEWRADERVALGRGATLQVFLATVGKDELEMGVMPWGEGHLKLNGREVAHIDHAVDRRHVFR